MTFGANIPSQKKGGETLMNRVMEMKLSILEKRIEAAVQSCDGIAITNAQRDYAEACRLYYGTDGCVLDEEG